MKMGGRGPGGSEARIFFRGQPISKTENSADLAHYFPENGGIITRTLKNGGTRPPVAEPLVHTYTAQCSVQSVAKVSYMAGKYSLIERYWSGDPTTGHTSEAGSDP